MRCSSGMSQSQEGNSGYISSPGSVCSCLTHFWQTLKARAQGTAGAEHPCPKALLHKLPEKCPGLGSGLWDQSQLFSSTSFCYKHSTCQDSGGFEIKPNQQQAAGHRALGTPRCHLVFHLSQGMNLWQGRGGEGRAQRG